MVKKKQKTGESPMQQQQQQQQQRDESFMIVHSHSDRGRFDLNLGAAAMEMEQRPNQPAALASNATILHHESNINVFGSNSNSNSDSNKNHVIAIDQGNSRVAAATTAIDLSNDNDSVGQENRLEKKIPTQKKIGTLMHKSGKNNATLRADESMTDASMADDQEERGNVNNESTEEGNANDVDIEVYIKDYMEDLEKRIVMCPFAVAKCVASGCNQSITYCKSKKSILEALNKHEKKFHKVAGDTTLLRNLRKQCRHDFNKAVNRRKRKWATEFATAARAENSKQLVRQMLAPFVDEEPKECQDCLKPDCKTLSHWEKACRCPQPCGSTLKTARGSDGMPIKKLYANNWKYHPNRDNPSPMPIDLFDYNGEAIREYFHWHMRDLVTAEMDRMEREAAESASAPNQGPANLAAAAPAVPPSNDTQVPAAVAPPRAGSEHVSENAVSTRHDNAAAPKRDSSTPKDCEAEPPQVVVSYSNRPTTASNDNNGPVSAEVAAQCNDGMSEIVEEEKVLEVRWGFLEQNGPKKQYLTQDVLNRATKKLDTKKESQARVQEDQARIQAGIIQTKNIIAQQQARLAEQQAQLAQIDAELVDATSEVNEEEAIVVDIQQKKSEIDGICATISDRSARKSKEVIANLVAAVDGNGAGITAAIVEQAAAAKEVVKKESETVAALKEQVMAFVV